MSGLAIDSDALLEIESVGKRAFADREALHKRIVQIAMAMNADCGSFVSDEVHAQYMELCDRIMDRISNMVLTNSEPNAEHKPRAIASRAPCSCSVWPCPTCGAVDMEDAGNKCRADWVCAADDQRQIDYEREQSAPNAR